MENSIQKRKQEKSLEYEIRFDKKALRFLERLDFGIRKRIWNKLLECKKEPFRYLKSLSGIEGYKLRVGDYRVIVSVEEEIRVLYVEKIGHRKNVYS